MGQRRTIPGSIRAALARQGVRLTPPPTKCILPPRYRPARRPAPSRALALLANTPRAPPPASAKPPSPRRSGETLGLTRVGFSVGARFIAPSPPSLRRKPQSRPPARFQPPRGLPFPAREGGRGVGPNLTKCILPCQCRPARRLPPRARASPANTPRAPRRRGPRRRPPCGGELSGSLARAPEQAGRRSVRVKPGGSHGNMAAATRRTTATRRRGGMGRVPAPTTSIPEDAG